MSLASRCSWRCSSDHRLINLSRGRTVLIWRCRWRFLTVLIGLLRHHFDSHGLEFVLAPVDSWSSAHVSANNLFIVKSLDQLGVSAWMVLCNQELLVLIGWFSFNFTQQLIVPLNFKDHLTVNVFNVEILSGHQKSTSSYCIQSVSASSWVVET